MNAVDCIFAGLEKRKPDCFAVKQYKKYKLASGLYSNCMIIRNFLRSAGGNGGSCGGLTPDGRLLCRGGRE